MITVTTIKAIVFYIIMVPGSPYHGQIAILLGALHRTQKKKMAASPESFHSK